MTTQTSASVSTPAPRVYKILVAMAFEPTADVALIEGLTLAARNPNSEMHVVHATAEPGTLNLSLMAYRLDDAREQLDERVEAAWKQVGESKVIAHIRPGTPAEVVLQAAVDIDADLIVVGSHRRSGLRKLALGSVAERVLHTARCPVLVAVRKDYSNTTASPSIAPPCTDCIDARKKSENAQFWCERHSQPHLQPHIYVPRDAVRTSTPRMY